MKKIAINGFGRIGRALFRLLISNKNYEIVAINDIASPKVLAHLLKYDSIHGVLPYNVDYSEGSIICDSVFVPTINIPELTKLNWKKYDVDVVFECTGLFKNYSANSLHIKAGAKNVILSSAPSSNDIDMVVLGVNDTKINLSNKIISNASCTTNCAAPMIKVLDDMLGVQSAYVTTVHSYTSDQNLHDGVHSDLRRARSAPHSIIPTTTGAAKALSYIFPNILIGGCGIRVPVSNGSLTDITCIVKNNADITTINNEFLQKSKSSYKNIILYNTSPIVSVDILSNSYSCVFDSTLTYVMGDMVKIVGWYDNEYGYASRLIDLLDRV
tara:strand:+ start:1102 stop:2082 length:981 start_codon:yes stop_codon:yes gene_type:complete